jgi:hypothetical protein
LTIFEAAAMRLAEVEDALLLLLLLLLALFSTMKDLPAS